jgi:serine/threonine-protein kinase
MPARPRITIRSAIAGSVYIDGRRVGDTPVTTTVAPGKHELRLDTPGYDAVSRQFDLGDSGEIVLDLEPQRRGGQRTPAPSVMPSPTRSPDRGSGHLTLTTRPWTAIYLDGKHVGQTPIELTLSPGQHEIKMIGKDQRIRKTMTLDVVPGQQSNLSFSFDD